MRSIMSRSRGRKSWSMIRSAPALAKRSTIARDPARLARIEPVLATGVGAEDSQQVGLASIDLGLVAPDEHSGHRRSRQRRGIPPDRRARRVEVGKLRDRALR